MIDILSLFNYWTKNADMFAYRSQITFKIHKSWYSEGKIPMYEVRFKLIHKARALYIFL
jgi:hypothetical protein